MAFIIGERNGVTQTAPPSRPAPRLSTPEPLGVPRWDDEPSDVFDFGTLMQEYVPPSMSQPVNTSGLGEGLSLPGLNLPGVEQWLSGFQKAPEYTPSNAAGLFARAQATQGGGKSGGMGLASYGYSGNSGVAGTKGKSPYGFQTPMWQALGQANAALKAAGLGTFGITDGWRSLQAQVDVKKRKGNLAATPGRSVHGIGLAADLKLTSKQYKWLKANGAKFGLVNLPSESWHWQMNPALWKGRF